MATDTESKFDLVAALMSFEAGEMDDEQIIELFQHLVTTGLAWQLQGSYGRTAMYMIEEGYVVAP